MTTRRTFLLGGLAAVAATACGHPPPDAQPRSDNPSPPPTSPTSTTDTSRAAFVSHGPQDPNVVALTFHTNGDLRLAQQLLDITAKRRVPITCFVVGNWLEANPTWAAKLRDAGHELANHTYSHPDVTKLDAAHLADEINRCRDVLTRLAGAPGHYFRPSGTDDGTAAPAEVVLKTAAASGYATVLGFDVDPLDYKDPSSATVVTRTLAAVRNGSIISLHFGHPGTIEALPKILDVLDTKQLRPVTVSELLKAR